MVKAEPAKLHYLQIPEEDFLAMMNMAGVQPVYLILKADAMQK